MSSGKHSSSEVRDFDVNFSASNIKKIVQVIVIILAVIIVIACVIFGMRILKNNEGIIPTTASGAIENNNQDNVFMPNKVGDFKVLGKLIIEKIDLEQYVLEKTNEESLKVGLTKLYGNSINMKGNFCITGHNTEGMFKNLSTLEKEDTFYIEDTKGNKVTYKVYDKYSVQSDDLKCLMPNEKEKEVTLITCNQGAQTKLVVKAKETKEQVKANTASENKISTNSIAENKTNSNTALENKATSNNVKTEN